MSETSSGIAQVEAKKPKVGPKVLSHLEIHPQLGGGHVVRHVYTNYQHEPREYKFGAGQKASAAMHVLRHAGLGQMSDAETEGMAEEEEIRGDEE